MSDYKFEVTLLADDVVGEIRDNEYELMDLIPELKDMVGFSQNGFDKQSDLWHYTLQTLALTSPDLIVRLAVLLQNIGKPHACTGENDKYQNVSSDMAHNILSRLHYSEDCIEKICFLIKNCEEPLDKKFVALDDVTLLRLYEVKKCDGFANDMYEKNQESKNKHEFEKCLVYIDDDYFL